MAAPLRLPPGSRIGLTTTIPVEVVLAAGLIPVDLNNIFIASLEAYRLVQAAETAGLPRTICAWIKGIYATLKTHPEIRAVIVATQGDCSFSQALGELLESQGREVIHFNFPYPRNRQRLREEMEALMDRLGVTWTEVARVKEELAPIRRQLILLDRLTWESGQVSGRENFQYLISSSDFGGDPGALARSLAEFLAAAQTRAPREPKVRLGLAGIPPIFTDLWDYLEELQAEVVFNEIPRQFSLPHPDLDLVEQYHRYTYPYDVPGRLQDLAEAAQVRRLDGIIHYTQSFCFRQMYDPLFRERLGLPVLTIEGDRPGPLDSRTRLRLEAFVDVLRP
jgi:benzoyl-CoA reductase/2-hydroxyglutaryl-CoA dehydratase subunit BcrC/BadD/HgdB